MLASNQRYVLERMLPPNLFFHKTAALILVYLSNNQPRLIIDKLSLLKLSREMNITIGTLMSAKKDLLSMGLVTCPRNGKRSISLRLTEKGREVAELIKRITELC